MKRRQQEAHAVSSPFRFLPYAGFLLFLARNNTPLFLTLLQPDMQMPRLTASGFGARAALLNALLWQSVLNLRIRKPSCRVIPH
jgi:hypothetical protein